MKPSPFYSEGYDYGRYDIGQSCPYRAPSYAFEEWQDGYTDGIIDRMDAAGDDGRPDTDPEPGDMGEIADYGKPEPSYQRR